MYYTKIFEISEYTMYKMYISLSKAKLIKICY